MSYFPNYTNELISVKINDDRFIPRLNIDLKPANFASVKFCFSFWTDFGLLLLLKCCSCVNWSSLKESTSWTGCLIDRNARLFIHCRTLTHFLLPLPTSRYLPLCAGLSPHVWKIVGSVSDSTDATLAILSHSSRSCCCCCTQYGEDW